MEWYFFLPEKAIKISEREGTMIMCIGYCPNANEIYLYGQANESILWEMVLIHEHEHAVLHSLGVPTKFHEIIISKMQTISDNICKQQVKK